MTEHDKITCHQIEQALSDGSTDPASLSVEALRLFLEYLCMQERFSDPLFSACVDALEQKSPASDPARDKRLLNGAYAMYAQTVAPGKKRLSVGKAVALLAAAALLIGALSVVVYAAFNPFSDFGVTIRDLFHMEDGSVLSSGDKELYVGGELLHCDSIEQAEDRIGVSLLRLEGCTAERISLCAKDGGYQVMLSFRTKENELFSCIADVLPNRPATTEEDLLTIESVGRMPFGDLTVYYLYDELPDMVWIYDTEVSYTFSSQTPGVLQKVFASSEP